MSVHREQGVRVTCSTGCGRTRLAHSIMPADPRFTC
jgi:hypothetical protein